MSVANTLLLGGVRGELNLAGVRGMLAHPGCSSFGS